MEQSKVICERTIFVVANDGQKSPVRVAIRVPNARTKLENKLSQVSCIVETDMGLGATRREMLGYDLMNALAQALIGIEVFILSLGKSARLELEDGSEFDRDVHSVFFGDIYREYSEALKSQKAKRGRADEAKP